MTEGGSKEAREGDQCLIKSRSKWRRAIPREGEADEQAAIVPSDQTIPGSRQVTFDMFFCV